MVGKQTFMIRRPADLSPRVLPGCLLQRAALPVPQALPNESAALMGRTAVGHPPRPGENVNVLSMRLIFRLAFDAIEFEKHVHCHHFIFVSINVYLVVSVSLARFPAFLLSRICEPCLLTSRRITGEALITLLPVHFQC